jgi:hypothetical protein
MPPDWEMLKGAANEDGEFRLHARFWNADLRFTMGAESTAIRVRDGEIHAIQRGAGGSRAFGPGLGVGGNAEADPTPILSRSPGRQCPSRPDHGRERYSQMQLLSRRSTAG